jgi:WD40 repeat protein
VREITRRVSSPDGKRTAEIAKLGEASVVVLDGVDGKSYAAIATSSLSFSPDSRRLAYAAKIGDKWMIVVDGVESQTYDGLLANCRAGAPVAFSPDSQHVVYGGIVGESWRIVVDGVEGRACDNILGEVVFSPDSRQVAYVCKLGGKSVVIVDGAEVNVHDVIIKDSIVFSPDSQRIAYAALEGDKRFVVVDDNPGKAYDGIIANSWRFSPDSRRFVYGAKMGDKWMIVADGVEGRAYDEILAVAVVFSPDSRRVVYAIRRDGKSVVIVDGMEGAPCDGIMKDSIIFSPDSQRIACGAKVGDKWVIFVDGVAGKTWDAIMANSLAFSPDSLQMTYTGRVNEKWMSVTHGAEPAVTSAPAGPVCANCDSGIPAAQVVAHIFAADGAGVTQRTTNQGLSTTTDYRDFFRSTFFLCPACARICAPKANWGSLLTSFASGFLLAYREKTSEEFTAALKKYIAVNAVDLKRIGITSFKWPLGPDIAFPYYQELLDKRKASFSRLCHLMKDMLTDEVPPQDAATMTFVWKGAFLAKDTLVMMLIDGVLDAIGSFKKGFSYQIPIRPGAHRMRALPSRETGIATVQVEPGKNYHAELKWSRMWGAFEIICAEGK